MQLQSSAFLDQQIIPITYTCKGHNISPPLAFIDVPTGTASLALVVHDPDSPSRQFAHWLVWNIDTKTTQLAAGQVPGNCQQGVNDFGNVGYGGPCPHSGTHRYVFNLFALNKMLDLNSNTTRKQLLAEIQPFLVEQATLTGVFTQS